MYKRKKGNDDDRPYDPKRHPHDADLVVAPGAYLPPEPVYPIGRPKKGTRPRQPWIIKLEERGIFPPKEGEVEAAVYVMALGEVAEQLSGGLTDYEYSALYKYTRKWRERAQGKDLRYRMFGVRIGRLDDHDEYRWRLATGKGQGGGD